jgi:DNA primase
MSYRIPSTYVLNKFMSYAIDPEFKKHNGQYNAACPICKEGKSFGKKKRLWYYPESNTFHCFNCSKTWSALNWIKSATGMTYEEVQIELDTNDYAVDVLKKDNGTIAFKRKELPDLPYDSINLFDEVQCKFYSSNKHFNMAVEYLKARRMHTAVNKSPNLFISLTDGTHSNRLCIPFYDRNKKIVFYQTRALDKKEPRYLGKAGYDKTVFGIDRVDVEIPYIFLFEGPIDAMFVKNGVAVAGISLTKTQATQLAEFPFHKRIWVLDNPQYDETAKEKMAELLKKGETVFSWGVGKGYKDFNEWAVFEDFDELDYNKIVNNTLTA